MPTPGDGVPVMTHDLTLEGGVVESGVGRACTPSMRQPEAPSYRLALTAEELRARLPAELIARPQWVAWRFEWCDDRWTKVPVNVRSGGRARTNDPSTWATFDEAMTFHECTPGSAGVGFVFTEADPFAGVDLDGCVVGADQEAMVEVWARDLLDAFETYAEISPSRRGAKLFLKGRASHNGRRAGYPVAGSAVETYDRTRFFTVTGLQVPGTPRALADAQRPLDELIARVWHAPQDNRDEEIPAVPAADDEALIAAALRARNGADFERLWAGDWKGRYGSQSEADLALCGMLAFYTGSDPERIDRLFQRSGLCRGKWQRADYRERTITKALAGRTEFYSGPRLSLVLPPSNGGHPARAQASGKDRRQAKRNARRAVGASDPRRFWEGRAFRPALLADALMQLDKYIATPVADDGVGAFLYAYRDGFYQRAEEVASKRAESLLGVRAANARIDDAVKLIRRRIASPHDSLNPKGLDLINVENGMLDWKAGTLKPHDVAYQSTIRIPVLFDPAARSEIIDRVLQDWFPGDALELAGEMLGYLLVPTRKHQAAFMLVGEGENGKSTFINLTRSFLGRGNVSSETLHDLEENRFRAASLFGKLANLCADIDDRALQYTSVFKKITGDDSLSAERKHQHPFDFDPFARLIFSANTPPAPRNDRTHAFFRRWVVVPFDNKFRDGEKRDRDLLTKITTPAALSALLNLALAGLQRLESRGEFALPESVRQAGEKYRREADAVYTFITEECARGGPDARVSATDLQRSFRAWCAETGYRSVPPKKALERQLVELLGAEKDRARVGGRKNAVVVWRGITCSYSPPAPGEVGEEGSFEATEDRWP